MWLIDASTAKLVPKPFYDPDIPPYAILSHTWGNDEVDFQDFKNQQAAQFKAGWSKIKKTCEKALGDGLQYAWVDTCCIDKSSSAELSEAINSMFFWYQQATKCYVYLSDFGHGSTLEDRLPECRWFTRGWTLQELLAPQIVIFLDSLWEEIGTKTQICALLSSITLIPTAVILGEVPPSSYSIAQRMSWAASRVTSRIEDTASCLLGIFDVYMPLLYGERHRAFFRLQEEISKTVLDMTLLAWQPTSHATADTFCSVIAQSPALFKHSGNINKFSHETRTCSMSALRVQFGDEHPIRLDPTRPEYFVDLGKTGRKPHRQIVSIAVTMIGPSLYIRNGQLPLRLRSYNVGERERYHSPPLPYPIQLATKPLQDSVRLKNSVLFRAHSLLEIVDGLPRRLWNESRSLFYCSRNLNLRALKLKGTVGGVPLQLVVLVVFTDHTPRCLVLDQKEYPEQAADFLNHAWFENNAGLLLDSLEGLHINDRKTICHERGNTVITVSIKNGVCNDITEKVIWIGSIEVTET